MFCTKCGAEIPEGASFCTACGTPVEGAQQTVAEQPVVQQPIVQQPVQQQVIYQPVYDEQTAKVLKKAGRAKGFGIAGIICGLISPLLGWIFGGIAISNANKGLAINEDSSYKTGKTLGIIAVIVSVINFILGLVLQNSDLYQNLMNNM